MADFRLGGTSFPLLAPDGTATAPSYSFGSDPDAGMYLFAPGQPGMIASSSAVIFRGSSSGITLRGVGALSWGNTSSGTATPDTQITRAAAGSFTFSNASTNSFTVTAGASGLATFGGGVRTSLATAILGSATTITGGATGNVPTLTAGPVTGNPTKWLPYDDNGTTRYIPAW